MPCSYCGGWIEEFRVPGGKTESKQQPAGFVLSGPESMSLRNVFVCLGSRGWGFRV